MVRKKYGTMRFYFNDRYLDKITKLCTYSLSHVNKILYYLWDVRYFSGINFLKAFWQKPLSASSYKKKTFPITGRDLFESVVFWIE